MLQHPREEDTAIGTARMASLCLPNSQLHVGVEFDDCSTLWDALENPEAPPVLLYPGPDAVDIVAHPPPHPVTLVVVDGTWWQAHKLIQSNRRIAALKRYAFTAPSPSEYRIRREPSVDVVSTIEALAYVLGVLEGDAEKFQALLRPFRAMVDMQIAHATTIRGARVRHRKPLEPAARRLLPDVMVRHPERVVCVTGEANAWPYRDESLRTSHEQEIIHLVAHRIDSGETLDILAKPRNPVAPNTPNHVHITLDDLMLGMGISDFIDAWRNFVHPDDILCSWGFYATSLLAKEAPVNVLPASRIDVRQLTRAYLRGRVGTMHEALERLELHGPHTSAALGRGRAGARLSQLVRIVEHLQTRAGLTQPRGHAAPDAQPDV